MFCYAIRVIYNLKVSFNFHLHFCNRMWLKCSLYSKNCSSPYFPAIFFELPIARTSDNSNFFRFPLKVRVVGSRLYVFLLGKINSVIVSLVLLGLFTDLNDAFPYPFIYFSYGLKKKFRCAEAFLLRTGRFFLLFSAKKRTSCQQNKQSLDKLEILCSTKFLRVLIFAIFVIFRAIRKNGFPKKKLPQTFFPKKFTPELLKFATQKFSTKKSCLFNLNLPLTFRNKTVYNELLVLHRVPITRSMLFENMYIYCTLIARN